MDGNWFVRCFQCGKQTSLDQVQRREMLTGVTTLTYWFRFTPLSYKNYALVDLCPGCSEQVDETYTQRRRRLGLVIGGIGLGLFGWAYLGLAGLVGAGVVIMCGAFVSRSKRVTLLPVERNNHG